MEIYFESTKKYKKFFDNNIGNVMIETAKKTISAILGNLKMARCYYRNYDKDFYEYSAPGEVCKCPMCIAKYEVNLMVKSDNCPLYPQLLDIILKDEMYDAASILINKGSVYDNDNAVFIMLAYNDDQAYVCIAMFIKTRKIYENFMNKLIDGSLFEKAHHKDVVIFPLDCTDGAGLRKYLATQIFLLNIQFVNFKLTREQMHKLLEIANFSEIAQKIDKDNPLCQHVVDFAIDHRQQDVVYSLLKRGFIPTAEVLDTAILIGDTAILIACITRLREYCTS